MIPRLYASRVREASGHDWGFFVWMLPAFLISFGAIAMLSLGLPFFVLGVLLFVALLRSGPTWPADLGVLAGVGATCLLVAALAAAGGGRSPNVWALVGLALTAGSAGGFWWLRCRPRATD